jgi:hypothetical protein
VPEFMSAAHVEQMNRLLAASEETRAATADLDREIVLAYRLADGPDGQTVHWQMRFSPADGMAFALGPPDRAADLTLVGDWRHMIAQTKVAREGGEPRLDLDVEGDPSVMEEIGAAFAAGQAVATVPVTFPDL